MAFNNSSSFFFLISLLFVAHFQPFSPFSVCVCHFISFNILQMKALLSSAFCLYYPVLLSFISLIFISISSRQSRRGRIFQLQRYGVRLPPDAGELLSLQWAGSLHLETRATARTSFRTKNILNDKVSVRWIISRVIG